MGAKSSIEWTDASWSPIRARDPITNKIGWHCEHVTTGCINCYAEGMNKRLGTGLSFKPGNRNVIDIFLDEEMLLAPLHWKKPRMIFVCSMTDLFADFVPDEWIVKVLDVIRRTSWDGGSNCGKIKGEHTYQVLTKRAARMAAFMPRLRFNPRDDRGLYLSDDGKPSVVMKNLWLGVSAERQQEADERIPHLLQTPAAIRFVSLEPLLGPIDLTQFGVVNAAAMRGEPDASSLFGSRPALDWVIAGGESGKNARPMHPDWARSLQKQCEAAGVKFFFKQRGEYTWVDDSDYDSDRIPDLPQNWRERTDDKYICMRSDGSRADGYGGDSAEFLYRVGKKAAGRLLDGREWNQMPEVRP